jgi:hypothetical protein
MLLLVMSPPSYNPYPAGCSTAKINFVKFGESMVDNNSTGSGSCGREKLYMEIRSSRSSRQDENEIPVISNRAISGEWENVEGQKRKNILEKNNGRTRAVN